MPRSASENTHRPCRPDEHAEPVADDETFTEMGTDHDDQRRNSIARRRRLVAQLGALGHNVTLEGVLVTNVSPEEESPPPRQRLVLG